MEVRGDRLTDRHRIILAGNAGYVRVKDRSSSLDRVAGELDLSEDDLKIVRLDVDSEGSRAELADAIYDITKRRAEVSSILLRGEWGDVKGGGTVALDATEQSQFHADVNNVDAGWLMRTLKAPYTIASRVSGKVRAQWPGLEYLKATGDADATLTPTSDRVTRSTMPVGGRLIVHGNNGRIDAQLVRVTAAGAAVTGRLAVAEDRSLNGQITGRAADVARVTASLEAFLGRARGSLLPTPVNGAVAVDARIAGHGRYANGDDDGEGAGAQSRRTPTAWRSTPTSSTRLPRSTCNALISPGRTRARMWTDVSPCQRDRRIALNLVADEVGVPWLLKVVNQADVPASGTLSAKGTVGGTTARPTATVAVQGSNLVAYEEEFGSLSADVGLAGREVAVSRLVIDKPQPDQPGRISATGHLSPRSPQLHGRCAVGRTSVCSDCGCPAASCIRGDVQLAARGAGSVDSPAGTAESRSMRSRSSARPATPRPRRRSRPSVIW